MKTRSGFTASRLSSPEQRRKLSKVLNKMKLQFTLLAIILLIALAPTLFAQERHVATYAGVSGSLGPQWVSVAARFEVVRARRSDRFTRFDGNVAGLAVPSPADHVTSATRLERFLYRFRAAILSSLAPCSIAYRVLL